MTYERDVYFAEGAQGWYNLDGRQVFIADGSVALLPEQVGAFLAMAPQAQFMGRVVLMPPPPEPDPSAPVVYVRSADGELVPASLVTDDQGRQIIMPPSAQPDGDDPYAGEPEGVVSENHTVDASQEVREQMAAGGLSVADVAPLMGDDKPKPGKKGATPE